MVMRKYPKGDFPQGYYDQCACYLKVTELKRWYLAMLVFGVDFKVFLMTTVKDEYDRYAYLKGKLDKEIPLTEDEVKEWDSNYEYLEACYYIDQAELDACQFLAKKFIDRVKDGGVCSTDFAWSTCMQEAVSLGEAAELRPGVLLKV